jgi:hypothetical protein
VRVNGLAVVARWRDDVHDLHDLHDDRMLSENYYERLRLRLENSKHDNNSRSRS